MKDINGYEGLYAVTINGQIWAYPKGGYASAGRWKEGRFLRGWKIGNGYLVVSLYKNGKNNKFLVHRLVAETFIKNPNNYKEVNHLNGNRLDNSVSNLEWVSSKQNKKHAWNSGLYTHKGENHYLTKFTEDDIREIRNSYKQGNISQYKLAKIYKVNQMTINCIVRYKTWKHIS